MLHRKVTGTPQNFEREPDILSSLVWDCMSLLCGLHACLLAEHCAYLHGVVMIGIVVQAVQVSLRLHNVNACIQCSTTYIIYAVSFVLSVTETDPTGTDPTGTIQQGLIQQALIQQALG